MIFDVDPLFEKSLVASACNHDRDRRAINK